MSVSWNLNISMHLTDMLEFKKEACIFNLRVMIMEDWLWFVKWFYLYFYRLQRWTLCLSCITVYYLHDLTEWKIFHGNARMGSSMFNRKGLFLSQEDLQFQYVVQLFPLCCASPMPPSCRVSVITRRRPQEIRPLWQKAGGSRTPQEIFWIPSHVISDGVGTPAAYLLTQQLCWGGAFWWCSCFLVSHALKGKLSKFSDSPSSARLNPFFALSLLSI